MSDSNEETCNDDSKQPVLVLDLLRSILERLSFVDFHRAPDAFLQNGTPLQNHASEYKTQQLHGSSFFQANMWKTRMIHVIESIFIF
ncbi:unnamed protein product [Arabidopsis halleri]